MDYSLFCEKLLELLKQNKVTEKQLSEDLKHYPNYVSRVLQGKIKPPLSFMLDVCEYFRISPAEFWRERSRHPEVIKYIEKRLSTYSDKSHDLLEQFIDSIREN